MPMYPLLNIRTLKSCFGGTAFGFERKLSGSTRESRSILYFLLGMYWIQRETGRTRVTGLVPSDVVALLLTLICAKVLLIGILHFCHLRRENGTTTFSFICFLKKYDSNSCEKFHEDMWLRVQLQQDYKLQNLDDFYSFAQKTLANGIFGEDIEPHTFILQQP